LSILVQVPEDENTANAIASVANAIASVATICADKSAMAKVLTDAGVRDSANQPPQASAIVSAEAGTTTTETVTVSVTQLPKATKGQLESAKADEKVDGEDKKEEKDEDSGGLTVGMIVGIAVGCAAIIGVVAGTVVLVFSRKRSLSASSSRNNNKNGHQDVMNPVSGLEMAEPKLVTATTVVEAMPVPVAAPPPPQGGGVQPAGYQNGIPYYMGADGQTTWTQPKIL
jgi:hypothetical protein